MICIFQHPMIFSSEYQKNTILSCIQCIYNNNQMIKYSNNIKKKYTQKKKIKKTVFTHSVNIYDNNNYNDVSTTPKSEDVRYYKKYIVYFVYYHKVHLLLFFVFFGICKETNGEFLHITQLFCFECFNQVFIQLLCIPLLHTLQYITSSLSSK